MSSVVEYCPIVFQHLNGDIQFYAHIIGVSVVFLLGDRAFRWVDEVDCGLSSYSVFCLDTAGAGAAVVGVEPVEEFVDKGAAFLGWGHVSVDDDGLHAFIVVSAGWPMAVDLVSVDTEDVWYVVLLFECLEHGLVVHVRVEGEATWAGAAGYDGLLHGDGGQYRSPP